METLGRTINVLLMQNTGNGLTGNVLDVSDQLEDIGSIGFELDRELNRAGISGINLKLIETPDGSIWSWIENQLQSSDGVYPPFCVVLLGGEPRFYGVVDPRNIQRTQSADKFDLTVTAQDWSTMLQKLELDTDFWRRQNPLNSNPRPAANTRQGKTLGAWAFLSSVSASKWPIGNKVYFPTPNNWFQVGDRFTCASVAGTFTCIETKEMEADKPFPGSWVEATLEGFQWPKPAGDILYWLTDGQTIQIDAQFTRLSEETTEQTYFRVERAVTPDELDPVYSIELDLVNGIVPGDVLDLRPDLSRSNVVSFTVLDVDPERREIILTEPIEQALAVGDRLYYSQDTLKQLVFGDVRQIIAKANTLSDTDFSRFQPARLPVPALSWLPFRVSGRAGDQLLAPWDLQPTLSAWEVRGEGTGYAGSPEDGWTRQPWSTRVSWTDQLVTAPASIMTDLTASLAPSQPSRNRNRSLLSWKLRNDGGDPADGQISTQLVAHDYAGMRRIRTLRTGASVTATQAIWSGSSWGTASSIAWSGAAPQDMIPFPAVASSLGAGSSWLCLDSAGSLRIVWGVATATTTLPEDLRTGRLRQTPWGAYLVTAKGYAKITYQAGSLSVQYVSVTSDKDINLIPNTFVALDEDRVYCLASTVWTNPENLKRQYEVYALELAPNPTDLDGVRSLEKVCDGSPRVALAFRDPQGGRVVGLLGSRLFQISDTMSLVIERYSTEGLTAAQLIENVCLIHNCIALPRPDGVLSIVSRNWSETPTDIDLMIDQEQRSRLTEYFLSQCNVSGNQDSIYGWARSSTLGGRVYEMQSHPFITTSSQARAVALAYVDFFGTPRKLRDLTVSWVGSGQAPWETLEPNQIIRINGIDEQWYLLKCNYSLKTYEATLTLLQV